MNRLLLGCATPIALTAIARADNFYGTTTDSPDRYAHPRSIEEYRRFIPVEADRNGMRRNAAHVDQCVIRRPDQSFEGF
jgi:hypothetical protein